jgi:ABC-type multidrug transport system permease subunit
MKMKSDYTLYNQSSIQNYSSIDNVDQAVEYLKDPTHFRSFGQGLTELLQKKNAPVDFSDNAEMADYLFSKLKDIGSTISRATVMSWFTGNHRPKVEAGSRPKIYELCFAMQLTYEETVWFFQHVYYDRAFNCHNIREAVYYYSFLHQLSYQKAQEIIQKIDAAPVTLPVSDDIDTYYTSYVQNTIAAMESADELIDFLIANKADFCHWNKSALHTLHDLISQLIGSKESDDAVNELRTTLYAKGATEDQAMGFLQPIVIDTHPLNNPWLNYSVYLCNTLIPGVLMLLIFMVTVYSIGVEIKDRTAREWLRMSNNSIYIALAGKLLPHTVVFFIMGIFYNVYLYGFLHFPCNSGIFPMIFATLCLVLASQCCGIVMIGTLPTLRLGLSFASLWGVISFSISGFSFPVMAMHPVLQALSNLFPLRHYFLIYVDQALNGYNMAYSWSNYMALLIFMMLPFFVVHRLKEALVYYKYIP